jgi:hypothetical protein
MGISGLLELGFTVIAPFTERRRQVTRRQPVPERKEGRQGSHHSIPIRSADRNRRLRLPTVSPPQIAAAGAALLKSRASDAGGLGCIFVW